MDQQYSYHEMKSARETAEALNDLDSLQYHLQNTRMFTEAFLQKQLNTVLSIAENKIKKSRAALYTYLVNKNSKHGDDGH